jgi:hypothetical protein
MATPRGFLLEAEEDVAVIAKWKETSRWQRSQRVQEEVDVEHTGKRIVLCQLLRP